MNEEKITSKTKNVFDEPVKRRIKRYRKKYTQVLDQLRQKSVLTVAFQVIHRSIWKYDQLFRLMQQDPFFKPVVFVCPYLRADKDQMIREMVATYNEMKLKGYDVVSTYNNSNQWTDIKNVVNPDIVFFSVPFDYTHDEYRLHYFTESLSCYVPYFFITNGKERYNYDGPFHNLVWRNFYETDVHKEYAQKYARNKGDNVVVSGYPPLDDFLYSKNSDENDPWSFAQKKRIIWAPHHTIEGQGQGLDYSTFKQYSAFFQVLAKAYFNHIQIAFKPHPMLKEKLYKDAEWGQDRTDSYYRFWEKQENGMLHLSGYKSLFLHSDALIHDCSSFMVEYLTTSKPPLYLLRDDEVSKRLHDFGKMALEQHYQARNSSEIVRFIEDQIIGGRDPKINQRKNFVEQHLKNSNGFTASEIIIAHLKSAIKGGDHAQN